MIPSLIPDITSPTAFFLSEYCDSHDKRGAIDRKQLLSFGPEYLMQNNREMNGQHVYFSWTLCLFCEHNYLKYACFLKKHLLFSPTLTGSSAFHKLSDAPSTCAGPGYLVVLHLDHKQD